MLLALFIGCSRCIQNARNVLIKTSKFLYPCMTLTYLNINIDDSSQGIYKIYRKCWYLRFNYIIIKCIYKMKHNIHFHQHLSLNHFHSPCYLFLKLLLIIQNYNILYFKHTKIQPLTFHQI